MGSLSPKTLRQLLSSSSQPPRKRSDELISATPVAKQDFVRAIVRRVVFHLDRIEVEVHKNKLRAALLGEPVPQGSSGVICLALEMKMRRWGGEMRLVVPPSFAGDISRPLPSLLKAIARGRQWYEWIVAGEVAGRRSIADKIGFDERHVSQILECGFLAPDIVQAILDGRQPSDLTWEKLTRHVPLNWVEQRQPLDIVAALMTEVGISPDPGWLEQPEWEPTICCHVLRSHYPGNLDAPCGNRHAWIHDSGHNSSPPKSGGDPGQ
jgi:hypothetical protein